MSAKTCETRVQIVGTPLNLPLFMTGRNRFREDEFQKLTKYITKQKQFYAKHCNNEPPKVNETRDEKHLKRLIGFYPPQPQRCKNLRMTKITRDLSEDKPWRLPPGIYGIPKEPYESKRGDGGAHWRKKAKVVKNENIKENKEGIQWKFYDMPSSIECLLLGRYNKHKGKFLTNARDRKATSRCMITDPTTAYRNPADPSPAHYAPKVHEIAYNVSPKITQAPPNPHIFLPHTTVPDKCLPIVRRHISFEPAVGRYEMRIMRHCPCAKKIISVALHILVEREKRRKFRRLTYKKIKMHKHCYPDWDHVIGKGHCHLFHTPTGKPINDADQQTIATKQLPNADKARKTLELYADAKYINMINAPKHDFISKRNESIPAKTNLRFNCITKRVMRRQLRVNQKIVFNSGSERFPELEYRPVAMTAMQLRALKQTLPAERQLRNYPVMRKRVSDIRSHLYDTPPAHMRSAYGPTLRKRNFRFTPLPEPKVLITKKDLRAGAFVNSAAEFYYNKPIKAENYMKSKNPIDSGTVSQRKGGD